MQVSAFLNAQPFRPRRHYQPQSLFRNPRIPYFLKPAQRRSVVISSNMADHKKATHALVTDGPDWQELSAMGIKEDFVNGPNFATPSKEWQSWRLFGKRESDVRLVLYRDHASWCPYCHKVQMLIEAKRIPYLIKKVNMKCYGKKSEEYLKIVPTGLLPAIRLDGEVITESMDIMFLIEENFQAPHRKMIPTDDNEMMQAFHRYMRLERVFTGTWLGCLRGPMAMLPRGMENMHHTLDIIESSLGEFAGPFFYPGDKPSFVDINFSTIFERSRSALKFWRNLDIREGRPNLRAWFEAWEQWAPSMFLRSDDWTHIGALPPQIGDVRFPRTRAPMSLNVESERALHMLNRSADGEVARHQAAAAICRNHRLVIKDAIMGTKVPEQDHAHVDNAFRILTGILLDPSQAEVLELRMKREIPRSSWTTVGHAIRFERARCCAPRDMPIVAMRQFCGGINWILGLLGQEL